MAPIGTLPIDRGLSPAAHPDPGSSDRPVQNSAKRAPLEFGVQANPPASGTHLIMQPAPLRTRALRAYLRHGGLIAYATQAVFGLGCDPRSAQGLKRLRALKQRPMHKGFIVIADTPRRLARFHQPLPAEFQTRCLARWPGPHTWLMPAARGVLPTLRGRSRPRGTPARIALRVDAHPDAAVLCRALRMALVSTSANAAGKQPLKTTRSCRQRWPGRVRVIPGRVQRHARPSTIADLLSEQIYRK